MLGAALALLLSQADAGQGVTIRVRSAVLEQLDGGTVSVGPGAWKDVERILREGEDHLELRTRNATLEAAVMKAAAEGQWSTTVVVGGFSIGVTVGGAVGFMGGRAAPR